MTPAFERWALLGAFVLYFLAVFVWPTFRVWRRTGQNPVVLARGDDVFGFVSRWFKYLLVLLLVYLVLQATTPALDRWAGQLEWLNLRSVKTFGWIALAVSAIWLIVAQIHMGQSWRIGIDTERRTGLVTQGLFSYSRNPIFLAMRVNLAALFLLRPNALTLTLLVAGELLIQMQVRLEEAHLQSQHGPRYAEYRARVRRWL